MRKKKHKIHKGQEGFTPPQFSLNVKIAKADIIRFKHRLFGKHPSVETGAGFTLIELLVVTSIISLLSSIIMVSTVNARKRARDTVRKQNIVQIQKALELYYAENQHYPTSPYYWNSSELGDAAYHGPDWIPGLTSKYIAQLPHDPLGGDGCNPSLKRGYMYMVEADGLDYKLITHCSVEASTITQEDSLLDPARDGGPSTDPGYPYYTGNPSDRYDPKKCDDPTPGHPGDADGEDGNAWAWAVYSSPRSRCW